MHIQKQKYCLARAGLLALLVLTGGADATAFAADADVQGMVDALTPRVRRGAPQDDRAAIIARRALDHFKEVRTKRGPSIRDRSELYAALQGLPQLDVLTIYFAFDSADLEPQSSTTLMKIAEALSTNSLMRSKFVIAGHTDATGTAEYNVDLSQRRADAVRSALVNVYKVQPERLEAVGHGFEELADPKDPVSAKNRRVQIVNLGSE